MKRTLALAALTVGAAVVVPAAAVHADGPGWENSRTLVCGDTTYQTHLTPAGFGSAFHLDDGTGVIVAWHVEVLWPEVFGPDLVTTLDRGSSRAAVGTIACHYTDPVGLQVRFDGILTPARR